MLKNAFPGAAFCGAQHICIFSQANLFFKKVVSTSVHLFWNNSRVIRVKQFLDVNGRLSLCRVIRVKQFLDVNGRLALCLKIIMETVILSTE